MLKQEFSYCRSLKCVGLIVLEKNNREITLSANKMTELFVTLMLTSFFFFFSLIIYLGIRLKRRVGCPIFDMYC